MSARFEVVRSDAAQPWHARLIVNGRITWWTEQYARKVSAERALLSLARTFWPQPTGWPLPSLVVDLLSDGLIGGQRIPVRDVDERTAR